jgi:Dyp-type peroxidase family
VSSPAGTAAQTVVTHHSQAATGVVELADLQALLRSALRTLPDVRFGLYHLPPGSDGRRFLAEAAGRVTSAADRDVAVATQVGLTASGLTALGLPDSITTDFGDEFLDGMNAPQRSRFLGDAPADWLWGGPEQADVDLLVISYARDAHALAAAVAQVDGHAASAGVILVHQLQTHGISDIEPFGFRDGISQPYVPELASSADDPRARPVALGEFVLGYPNAYGRFTRRPVLDPALDPLGQLPRLPAGVDDVFPRGGSDLGRNGSYLVLRTLAQDVAGFEDYVAGAADHLGVEREWLAAKLVGRWRSGAPLVLSPAVDRSDLATANDFGFHHDDARGLRCPIGAHIRRANPRDALDPRPGSDASQAVTDQHRLLRRGRVFTDGAQQGLQFVALNANLGRQFEFVQHSWLNDPAFAGLAGDLDPLVAPRTPDGVFTIPGEPFRARIGGLPQFVTTLGGAYFFLPGLRALRYLADGAWEARR